MECFEEAVRCWEKGQEEMGKSGVKRSRNVSTVQGREGERAEMGKQQHRTARCKTRGSKNKQNQSVMILKKKSKKIVMIFNPSTVILRNIVVSPSYLISTISFLLKGKRWASEVWCDRLAADSRPQKIG